MNRVFIGFDKRESAAFWIAKRAIEERASGPVEVRPIVQQTLRLARLYNRTFDPLQSTEFTYTRFFVPYLAGYEGWALFMDCDMLVRGDITELFDLADPRYAVMCVQHDHRPTEKVKMGDQTQTIYPRKNWSSVVLWDCGHEANMVVTPDLIGRETGAFLHQFKWLPDNLIGSVPLEWNWLVGWNTLDECPDPQMVHYTTGIPGIHDGCANLPFADEYLALAERSI